jgi:hypothetical protein
MNRPTRYSVESSPNLVDLIEKVNQQIKVGWIPQGGIFIDEYKYYQAMCAYNTLGPYITRNVERESEEHEPA